MSASHYTSEHISEQNDYPEYLLGRNQESSPENMEVFNAAVRNDLPALQRAIRSGGKVDFFFRPEDSKNALHVASEHGYLRIVQELVNSGAHVNAVSLATKDTALILACDNKHTAVVKVLLEKGAEINRGNCYGKTPLHAAVHAGASIELISMLLKAGADPALQNHKGSTPLHFLCMGEDRSTHSTAVAEALIGAGAHVNGRDNFGITPILVCCSSGRGDMIDFLVTKGADPTVRDGQGRDAYATAAFYNREAIMKRFDADSPASRFGHK